jgi:hypothetical protein
MDLIITYPIVPIIAFIVVLSIFIFQAKNLIDEKKKNKQPNITPLKQNTIKENSKEYIQKIDNVKKLHSKRDKKNLKPIISLSIVLLILINMFIVTYFLKDKKTTYIPRANLEPTVIHTPFATEILTNEEPVVSKAAETTNTQQPTATITPSVDDEISEPTITVFIPTISPTSIPTLTPTIMLTPTLIPTRLFAKANPIATSTPIELVKKLDEEVLPTAITEPTVFESIPEMGATTKTVILLFFSLLLIIAGLIM